MSSEHLSFDTANVVIVSELS